MPLTGIPDLAARLAIDLGPGVEQTKESLLSAINVELRDLQVPQPTAAEHERQVVLIEARGELMGNGNAVASPSTDLVPISLVSQIVDTIQKGMAKVPIVTPSRPDPTLTMSTNVKATATQASADFTKARSLPFAGAVGLMVSVYGLRTYFDVGDLQLPSEYFYPLLYAVALAIVSGYCFSAMAQRAANIILRALYSPDVHEEALDRIGNDSADYFGSHSQRVVESRGEHGRLQRAIDDGAGIIINRSAYRYALRDVAYGPYGSRSFRVLIDFLSTIDLAAASDDATGLALDRLSDLKIIEPVVYRRRQAFRFISDPTSPAVSQF